MANKNKEPEAEPIVAGQPEGAGTAPELLEVGKLRSKHRTSWAAFAGVCAANGWKPGKMVSEVAYLEALEQFTSGPMRGSEPKSEVRK